MITKADLMEAWEAGRRAGARGDHGATFEGWYACFFVCLDCGWDLAEDPSPKPHCRCGFKGPFRPIVVLDPGEPVHYCLEDPTVRPITRALLDETKAIAHAGRRKRRAVEEDLESFCGDDGPPIPHAWLYRRCPLCSFPTRPGGRCRNCGAQVGSQYSKPQTHEEQEQEP